MNTLEKNVVQNPFARRAFISIEIEITNQPQYAVGVSYQ